jgi:regulator of sirC expression with transglutaminase-like and TPR domain
VFEFPSSSCLDSVLANKTGLPITLAVLHRAVGRRCGLDLQLVNMPGQVLNRAVLDGGDEVYIDVFAGQLLQEEGLRYKLVGEGCFGVGFLRLDGGTRCMCLFCCKSMGFEFGITR